MDCFIKKIFDSKIDDFVHLQFQKFSRGEFKGRAVVIASNSKGKYKVFTTPEYANELVRTVAEKIGNNKTKVTGIVVSTRDLQGELDFINKKQFMGIKQYVIEKEMTGKEIIDICDRFPQSFIGLSFSSGDTELKIKPKAPKSAKPSTKADEKPKADFCKLITNDKNIAKNILFDSEINIDAFKKAEIKHDFIITDIVVPNELKNEKDFAKIREMSRRKGKIVRHLNIDGKSLKKEANFEA